MFLFLLLLLPVVLFVGFATVLILAFLQAAIIVAGVFVVALQHGVVQLDKKWQRRSRRLPRVY